ncbi:uncharacterized protein LOC130139200 [Syzygium oleosum]|uniref:uncharacterized protein LOC130139200 n=1 Tax=Syzygium oleosum TaxID=219896 RepID=UPI0024BA23EC|nr:uncharacterized protein LOC130139200 [Syzygium oleosum]
MPQVDLETLVSACAGGSCDRKITCETIAGPGNPEAAAAAAAAAAADEEDQGHRSDRLEVPPDFPPESFWLSKDAEFDWFDRNVFYERKESTKASSNSGNLNPSSNSNSQRFSLNRKSKASIIGLPKPQKSCFVDAKNRKAANTRLFPKRNGSSAGKSNPPLIEPSSPKVSCMGRVRSKKDRNRRLRNRNRSVEPAAAKAKPAGKKRTGLFASFRSMFHRGGKSRAGSFERGAAAPIPEESPPRRSSARSVTSDIRDRLPAREADALSPEHLPRRSAAAAADGDAPGLGLGLGGMRRFASGRRSDAWANDADALSPESLPRRSGAAAAAADGDAPGLGLGLGGMMRFASGRRSDAWATEVA